MTEIIAVCIAIGIDLIAIQLMVIAYQVWKIRQNNEN